MSVFGSVRLALGERGYDVIVGRGLLAEAEKHIGPLLARPRVAVVTDANVERLHLASLTQALARGGIHATTIVLPAGEETKSFAHLEKLLDKLLDARIERSDTILALGGGVVGDITGFAAATLRRGTPVIQVPTTLLAQVDAAIGGKTGIDTRQGKNLVGAFHQPRLVLSDVGVLDTLPRRELLAGYAEVVKYGLLGDVRFFEWLEQHGQQMVAGDAASRNYAVLTSARMKVEIVQRDERESGPRALLNLGHTFAHALETELGYDGRLLHGEAVAAGLALAFELSHRMKLVKAADARRVRRHLAQVGLPAGLPAAAPAGGWDPKRLLEHMRQDKKVAAGVLTFVLVKDIGQAFVSRDVAEADVLGVLDAELAA
jgi:3-dehydroquinate synthase